MQLALGMIYGNLLPKCGWNTKIEIYQKGPKMAGWILDMWSIEVISTWKHIQKPCTSGSTSIFGLRRVNPILAIFGHTGPKMGQSQKNFGIRIKFKLGPNFGFNDKKVSWQPTARKLKKKIYLEKQWFSLPSLKPPTVRPGRPQTRLFWTKILWYIAQMWFLKFLKFWSKNLWMGISILSQPFT